MIIKTVLSPARADSCIAASTPAVVSKIPFRIQFLIPKKVKGYPLSCYVLKLPEVVLTP